MKIEPTYVTFEQAKLLRDKGFDEECKWCYDLEYQELFFHVEDIWKNSEIQNGYPEGVFERLGKHPMVSAPEQWQVCEWLRVEKGIWIDVTLSSDSKFLNLIRDIKNPNTHLGIARVNDISFFNSPQEAYSAAFDYILTNNLI